jgi:hypothetical protein
MLVGYYYDGLGEWIQNMVTGKLIRTTHVVFVESHPAHVAV